jgi:hypothetical protein
MNEPVQAFPSIRNIEYQENWITDSGMTLRDYFAAKAMQAILSNAEKSAVLDGDELAKNAYITADAMLKERLK